MPIDMSQFYQAFFDEAEEHLATMEHLLLGLDLAEPSDDDLNAIFRAAHSIKGSSGTFGFNDMTGVTHELETLLDRLRKHELKITSQMIDAFLEARDVIKGQLDAHRGTGEASVDAANAVIARLQKLYKNEDASVVPADVGYGFFSDQPAAVSAARSGTDEQTAETAPEAAAAQPATADESYGFFETVSPKEVTCGYGFFDPGVGVPPQVLAEEAGAAEAACATEPTPERRVTDNPKVEAVKSGRRAGDKPGAAQAEASTIRVGIDKVDMLINLVGELVITQAMLAQNAANIDPIVHENLLTGLAQLERNTRDLQESVMSIRMMPMSFVFSRFPRVVRDTAGKLGKEVELKTEGEATELDKGLIEKLADPLTHLVRNSLDHGIETPEQRLEKGKPRHGTLTLRAFQQGGNIYVEVSDDGNGLNRDKILAKARERGMAVSDTMTDQEVYALIFEAGFSTAEKITDVSGRGVGMDVVRRNIREMGGSVEIDSASGHGTRITIRLPLTLAILDGLSIAVGDETFIIPLTYISESLQPAAADIRTIGGTGRTVHVRGDYLPLIALHEVFGIEPRVTDPSKGITVILDCDGKRSALFVDALLGEHQVVIKSLETNYKRVPGIGGATIMGDGRVALILDTSALAQMSAVEERQAA
jgi:two-component system chemotaxis sensor kinase CheA